MRLRLYHHPSRHRRLCLHSSLSQNDASTCNSKRCCKAQPPPPPPPPLPQLSQDSPRPPCKAVSHHFRTRRQPKPAAACEVCRWPRRPVHARAGQGNESVGQLNRQPRRLAPALLPNSEPLRTVLYCATPRCSKKQQDADVHLHATTAKAAAAAIAAVVPAVALARCASTSLSASKRFPESVKARTSSPLAQILLQELATQISTECSVSPRSPCHIRCSSHSHHRRPLFLHLFLATTGKAVLLQSSAARPPFLQEFTRNSTPTGQHLLCLISPSSPCRIKHKSALRKPLNLCRR